MLLLDIDGTLLNYRTELPPSAADAVRQARARGHRVYLCTGRSRAEIYDHLWDLGVDGLIGGNGSFVEDAGQVVFHQVLDAAVTVHTRGGDLRIEWAGPGQPVRMTGPAVTVYQGSITL
ncbi:HAD-IIB family hydrolase [Rivihabitans pingtungensis]|uniref:HAD-IIB family hydrolase n=1 Tax=Rivihabitans pingtungensis TaxID=1054498 RepID=UPI003A5236B5